MKNGINNNKTFFVLTILFSLILNGIRAKTNDEIKSLVQDQYSKTNMSVLFSDIKKLPAVTDQIIAVEYLYKLVRENNDVNDTTEIFEFARQYNQFLEQNFEKMKAARTFSNVKLPECVETVVLKPSHICFDNGNYILRTYNNPFTYTLYYLYKGNCLNQTPSLNSYWKITSHKKNNLQDLQSLDKLARQLKNVKFELAPDGERCYVQVDGKYLTKDGDSEYLVLTDDKSPNGIWYVRSRVLAWFEEP